MRPPRFTDEKKYPHGYKRACETDIRKTFARVAREHLANKKEVDAKVEHLPNWKFKTGTK